MVGSHAQRAFVSLLPLKLLLTGRAVNRLGNMVVHELLSWRAPAAFILLIMLMTHTTIFDTSGEAHSKMIVYMMFDSGLV